METNNLKNKNNDYHSEFYSDFVGNCLASYTLNLTNFTGSKVCFDYIEKSNIFEITSAPSREHSDDSYGVCTNDSYYPTESGVCTGVMNTT
jgi:hypothetical protein